MSQSIDSCGFIEKFENFRGFSRANLSKNNKQVEIIEKMPKNRSIMPGNLSPMSILPLENQNLRPYIKIEEQPANAVRFRYKNEGPNSRGSLLGEHSTSDKKTFPTIRIIGYTGRMFVVVSCVTVEDDPNKKPRPHPHQLVDKKQHCKRGVCKVELKEGDNRIVVFKDLGIQRVRKNEVKASLDERKKLEVDPFKTGFADTSDIDLLRVRLCFQGIIPLEGDQCRKLVPIVSSPIFEKNSVCTLKIVKLSHYSASVAGGLKMMLFCDKLPNKETVQIRFFETHDSNTVWEDYADFQPTDIHHQYGITFKTPKYVNQDIRQTVQVKIQLKLESTPLGGKPLDFEMIPRDAVDRKRPWERVSAERSMPSSPKCSKTLSPDFLTVLGYPSPGPSTSSQAGPDILQERTQASPEPAPSMPTIYIPQEQYERDQKNYGDLCHIFASTEGVILNEITLQRDEVVGYTEPSELYPQYEQINLLNSANQPSLPSGMSFDSFESLGAYVKEKLTDELGEKIPIHEPASLEQGQLSQQNHGEFSQVFQMDAETQEIISNSMTIEAVVYPEPSELYLQNEGTNLLNLDNQPLLPTSMSIDSFESLSSYVEEKLSSDLEEGASINEPASGPDRKESSGMTDSFTRLTRDIETLNEICKPRLN